MLGWYDGNGWAGFFGMLFWVAVWLGLVSLVVWAMIRPLNRRTLPHRHEWHIQSNEPSALEILGRRYARGEIDTATYEQMREHLEGTRTPKAPVTAGR
jgi:putative membrane protein